MLDSRESCREYIQTQSPSVIAQRLRQDQATCQAQGLPSALAVYLPPSKSDLGDKISLELYPEHAKFPRSLVRYMQYDGLLQGIRAYLHQMAPPARHGNLPDAVDAHHDSPPSKGDIETALRVLDFCVRNPTISNMDGNAPLHCVVDDLNNRLNRLPQAVNVQKIKMKKKTDGLRKCYICRYLLVTHHPLYPSMCKPCGSFNLASSDLSMPQALRLDGRTALVTGGRINLGYHTALRLLRCGAKVIVTSRYPKDAVARYLMEKDSTEWERRLTIIGADFRAAGDVFHLVEATKRVLRDWGDEAKLDILINNAAQTWTDSIRQESQAIEREEQVQLPENAARSLLLDTSYSPRVRGGLQTSNLLQFDTEQKRIKAALAEYKDLGTVEQSVSISEHDPKTSWVQNLYEIPYEDVISAHSVNVFVPFILIRELLPLMGSSSPRENKNEASKPLGHIVNVSAREGVFESTPTNRHKNGYHVHTNLTKAALNMLTETEAATAWRKRRVAMNSVDPGYLSAAPEVMARRWNEECPIGWEDGAARVLWPIAVGESGKGAVWGRFLKDFGMGEGEENVCR
ncbi:short-chain dehydrogenase protein [Rutstroemia sp. NJR-2017a BBW]|nr:short-chain dehydrogenase protein [Rutstroemia sp. NJR-2017a BBW]